MSEKLSNISSEDIEMASAKGDSEGEDGSKGRKPSTTGSPGKIHYTSQTYQDFEMEGSFG